MNRVTRIGVLSLGKVMGMSGVLLGLIFGVIYGGIVMLAGVVGMASQQEGAGALGLAGFGGGLAVMIGVPIVYGLFSFVFGVVYGAILNLVLRMAGGLELEIQ